jgi:hypothetical protein
MTLYLSGSANSPEIAITVGATPVGAGTGSSETILLHPASIPILRTILNTLERDVNSRFLAGVRQDENAREE